MNGNILMSNLNFSSCKQFLTYFPEANCDDDAGHICDPSQMSDIKLLQR